MFNYKSCCLVHTSPVYEGLGIPDVYILGPAAAQTHFALARERVSLR